MRKRVDFEATKKLILEKTGWSEEKLKEELEKVKQRYDPELIKDPAIFIFILAKELGVEPVIKEEQTTFEGMIFFIRKGVYDRYFAYLYDGKQIRRVIFYDESKVQGLSDGDYVVLTNAVDGDRIKVFRNTEIRKIEEKRNAFKLDDFLPIFSENLKDNEPCYIIGLISEITYRSYKGCPKCFRKMSSNKCSCGYEGDPVIHKWVRVNVSDGSRVVSVAIPPSQNFEIEKYLGSVVKIYGLKKQNELLFVKLEELKGETKEEKEVEAGTESIEDLAKISESVELWVKMTETCPIDACVKFIVARHRLPEDKAKEIVEKIVEASPNIMKEGNILVWKGK